MTADTSPPTVATPIAAAPTKAAKSLHTPTSLYTRVHGKWYDLARFARYHPGGEVALRSVAGRDATCLFESYHPFTDRAKLDAILAKHEVTAEVAAQLRTIEEEHPGIPPTDDLFDWPAEGSAFGNDLKRVVRAYFEKEAARRGVSLRVATKLPPLRTAKLVVLGTGLIASIVAMVRTGSAVYAATTPTLAWLMAVNVFHDASHFALSHKPWVNTLCSYLFPYFESPFTWNLQHIIGHHAYPNIAHLDPDVAHTRHARRDHPQMDWLPAHQDQGKWYRLAPHLLLAVTFGLNIANEAETAASGAYNDAVPLGPQTTSRMVIHLLGRALTAIGVLGWPWLAGLPFGFGHKLALALLPTMWFSLLFMLNTQINHLTPHNITASSRDWYKHQVVTAQNFGPQSPFHFWMSGGLNHQLEHHLFPGINHGHLPNLQPLVLEVCKKHNVPYLVASGYFEAIKNYFVHTDNMAVKPKAD